MFEIVVAIPTYRRPGSLKRLLDAIEVLDTELNLRVIVGDNDLAGHAGADLCSQRAPTYRWPLEAMIVQERGVAQVRNALIERALSASGADFIAMIDDDEWPSPRWLDEFLRVQDETGADALQGSILFPDARDSLLARCDGIASIRRPSGITPMLQGTGNILIARASLERMRRPWFDPAFGLTGGEDHEFFVRLAAQGARFAWADGAVAYGEVPAERMSIRWVLARAYGIGNSDMRVMLKHGSGVLTLPREWLKIAGAIAASLVLSLVFLGSRERRLDGARLFFRAAGKAAAMFGIRHNAYGVPHGE